MSLISIKDGRDIKDEAKSKEIDSLLDSEDDSPSDDSDDDTFNPPSDTNEDEDASSGVYSFDDAPSCDKADDDDDDDDDDDANPPTAVVSVAPPKFSKPTNVKDKGMGKNVPKLTSAFKGFYTKDTVSKYDINGEDVTMVQKMNESILPISSEALDLEERLKELCSSYEKSIKNAGIIDDDKEQEKSADEIEQEIERLGLALEDTRKLLCLLQDSLAAAKDDRRKVESVRSMAKQAVDYWAPIDAQKLTAWQKVYIKTNRLLHLCDQHKLQQSKMKSALEAAAKAKARADAKSKAKLRLKLMHPSNLIPL